MPPNSPAIRTQDLIKDYGDLRALKGVSLEVEEGSFFGLLGPNGAGKTTFINILVGLARKSSGEAYVFGHDVEEEYREARDAIGLAPQEFNVDRFFPIREVLMHKAGYHGVPEEEAGRRADEALKTVGIYDKRDTRFDWLSGGMKRRLMLARAMVTDPDLLILDEPTAGVDVQLRHDLWDIIMEMNEEGTTVLLTTHYIEEAERLCDEVAILDNGEVVDVASPEDLMSRGLDTIYVRVRGTLPSTLDIGLSELGNVEEVSVEDDAMVVKARGGGRVAPDVLKKIESNGYEILDLEIKRTSLEEIFVEMTRRSDSETRRDEDESDESRGKEEEREGLL